MSPATGSPMPVEPPAYRSEQEITWQSVARALALSGALIGMSRVGTGIVHLWIYGFFGAQPLGNGIFYNNFGEKVIALAGDFGNVALGISLLASVIGLMAQRAWANWMLTVSERTAIIFFLSWQGLTLWMQLHEGWSASVLLYLTGYTLIELSINLAYSILALMLLKVRFR